jgi:5-methylcytosine-specific restriction endonuclease McrA
MKLKEPSCEPCREAMRETARRSYYRDLKTSRAKGREKAYRKAAKQPPKIQATQVLTCPVCWQKFDTTYPKHIYCSVWCRNRRRNPVRPQRASSRPLQPLLVKQPRVGRPWKRLRAQVVAEEGYCWLCEQDVDKSLAYPHPMSPSADHVIPICRGGAVFDRQNLRLAHLTCNQSRGRAAA